MRRVGRAGLRLILSPDPGGFALLESPDDDGDASAAAEEAPAALRTCGAGTLLSCGDFAAAN